MRQYNRVTILKNMAMRKVRDRRRSKDPPGSKVHGMNVRQNSRKKYIYKNTINYANPAAFHVHLIF